MTTTAYCANCGHTKKQKHPKSLCPMTSQSLKCPDVQNVIIPGADREASSCVSATYVVRVAMSIFECHMPIEVVDSLRRSPTTPNPVRPGPVSPKENWREEETQWELLKLSTLSKELEEEASRDEVVASGSCEIDISG